MKTDNELIEEFYISQGGKPHMKEDLWFYESDWNMLMLVVKHIFDSDFLNDFDEWKSMVKQIVNSFECIEISITREKVINFIKWYNDKHQGTFKS
jgi:hypothetical protein